MLRTRIIPCLQLLDQNLVKTVRFKKPSYIGDFMNTARIFNELEVDEMCVLAIRTTMKQQEPDFEILAQMAEECFMPLSYGGGITSFETGKRILSLGFEKLVINSHLFSDDKVVTKLSSHFGAQSLIGSIDVKKNLWGKPVVVSHSANTKHKVSPVEWAKRLEELGVGELLITSVDQEGTWEGFDIDLIRNISDSVDIPVIAHGGGGTVDHIGEVVKKGNASAVALGSMVVYQKKNMGVLINFPSKTALVETLK